jgi:hypothetical protein
MGCFDEAFQRVSVGDQKNIYLLLTEPAFVGIDLLPGSIGYPSNYQVARFLNGSWVGFAYAS